MVKQEEVRVPVGADSAKGKYGADLVSLEEAVQGTGKPIRFASSSNFKKRMGGATDVVSNYEA